jgi:hypothetical protein
MRNAIDDIKKALDIHHDARRAGFEAGFVIACVELSKTHGEGQLARYLLRDAGIGLERAKAAVESDDHVALDNIFREKRIRRRTPG